MCKISVLMGNTSTYAKAESPQLASNRYFIIIHTNTLLTTMITQVNSVMSMGPVFGVSVIMEISQLHNQPLSTYMYIQACYDINMHGGDGVCADLFI